MKRLALLVAVIAMMAVGASATVASASNGNPTPGCQSSSWDVTIFGFPGQVMDPLVRCHPTAGAKGHWTLSGTVTLASGCVGTISGTFKANAVNITWNFSPPDCFVTFTTTLTGTLNYDDGTGSGTASDTLGNAGTWTATRTS